MTIFINVQSDEHQMLTEEDRSQELWNPTGIDLEDYQEWAGPIDDPENVYTGVMMDLDAKLEELEGGMAAFEAMAMEGTFEDGPDARDDLLDAITMLRVQHNRIFNYIVRLQKLYEVTTH